MAPVKETDSKSTRKTAASLVEAAYWRMREHIMNGALQPGEKLRSERLKDDYHVGASTLREAMRRLVGEGLVISEEQRGFRVAPISLEDFADTSATRKLIEVEALRQSILHGDEAWEANIVAKYHKLSRVDERRETGGAEYLSEFEVANREFHDALIAACPSTWLSHFQSMLFQHSERYRRITLQNQKTTRDVHSEHTAIMAAALDRDVELACSLEGEHIERTVQSLSVIIREIGI